MQTNSQLKFRIILNAYNSELLNSAVNIITEKVNTLDTTYNTTSKMVGPIHLPVKKRRYSVLRSPHVDKSSFEQFEIRTHKWIIDITAGNLNYLNMLGFLNLPSGVDIKIKINELA